MKVVVNRDNCIGCGACEALCPEVFQIDDEGLSTVINNEIKEELNEKVTEAIESCSTSAISREEESNEKVTEAIESCPTSAIAEPSEEATENE